MCERRQVTLEPGPSPPLRWSPTIEELSTLSGPVADSAGTGSARNGWRVLLSETLVGDLDAWNDQAWSWVGTEVSDAVWPSEEDMAAWVDQGERLAARLRGELGADFVVVFHPHFEAW